jgi:hypothetical protein
MRPDCCVCEPMAACTLPRSRAVNAGLMSTGVSGEKKGGSPGSRNVNSAPEPWAALPQRARKHQQQQELPQQPQQQQQKTAARKKAAAAVTIAAAAIQAAVVATYSKVTTATLLTAAAEAAAAVWLTRSAAKKEVAMGKQCGGQLWSCPYLPRLLSISGGAHSRKNYQAT